MSKYDLVSIVRPTAEDSVVEELHKTITDLITTNGCLLYTSPSPRDYAASRMPSSA